MGGAVPGVVRAGRPRSQEAFIHTKNREHGLLHAGESGKTPYASLECHSPLEGESDKGEARSSQRGAIAAPREGRSVVKPSAVNLLQPRLRRSPPNHLLTDRILMRTGSHVMAAAFADASGLGLATYLVYRAGRILSLLLPAGTWRLWEFHALYQAVRALPLPARHPGALSGSCGFESPAKPCGS